MKRTCQRCKSDRVASTTGKCGDLCYTGIKGKSHDGYARTDMGLDQDYGDYISLSWCLNCGQIQGKFPVSPCALEEHDQR